LYARRHQRTSRHGGEALLRRRGLTKLRAMPVTFVGDVHGWSDRLDGILAQAVGEIVLLGDLVDRGPDAAGVLTRVRAACDRGARCLLGNHEFALVRALGCPELGIAAEPEFAPVWRVRYGGEAVFRSYGVTTCAALASALGPLLPWLAGLPWVLDGTLDDGRRWIAVHAGLDPDAGWKLQVEALRAGWAERDANLPRLFD
jgi:serine/threonine protein phosphatase 1